MRMRLAQFQKVIKINGSLVPLITFYLLVENYNRLFPPTLLPVEEKPEIPPEREIILTIGAVSYTHLDVYKRQIPTNP